MEGGIFETLLKVAVGWILLQLIRWSDGLEELQICLRTVCPRTFSFTFIGTKAD